jgi:hypothetical protein
MVLTVIRATVLLGSALAALGAAHAALNARLLRRPLHDPPATVRRVAVLIPARDEAAALPGLLADLRVQTGVPRMSVTVLDDASRDGTAEVAVRAAGGDPRRPSRLPGGWASRPPATGWPASPRRTPRSWCSSTPTSGSHHMPSLPRWTCWSAPGST